MTLAVSALGISPVILVHTVTALLALVIGATMMIRHKGDRLHRIGGRIYLGLMLAVAISSLFIRRTGTFSAIHILTAVALVSIPMALWHIRRGNVAGHRKTMIGLYLGLLTAGIFTLLPGRLMHQLLFGG